MIEELRILLENFQNRNHTLEEKKDFILKDEFQMKQHFEKALENSSFSILYDSLLTTVPLVDETNNISRKAMANLNDSHIYWVEKYACKYEAIILEHFGFTIKIDKPIQSEYIPVFFPIWNIHKEDLRDTIQFLKIYAIKSDYHLLDNESELMNLLAL